MQKRATPPPVNLSNVNVTIQQFQEISSGKYNAGEVRLSSNHSLVKVNDRVHSRGKNVVPISHAEVLAVKDAFVKALQQNGVAADEINRVRRELGLAPDGATDTSLTMRSIRPLSRRFPVSYHDIAVEGLCRPCQLPVTLNRPQALVTCAARGKNDADAYVVAGFAGAKPRLPSVTLNGITAVGGPERLANAKPYGGGLAKSAVRWKFPASALQSGENEIRFSADPDGKAKVVWCEIALPEPGTL